MKFSLLLLITVVLASSPGVVLLFADTGTSQILALLIFLLIGIIVILGILGFSVQKIVWFIIGIVLFVLLFSSGYISLFADLVPLTPTEVSELAISLLLVEVSLVSAMISSSFGKHVKEWSKSGFDLEEVNSEFSRLGNFSLILMVTIAAFSLVAYFFLDALPSISIDSITGLVVAVVVCFLVAVFLLNQKDETGRRCPVCYASAGPNDSFCAKCGARLGTETSKDNIRAVAKN
jgi:hypothetical protein